MQVTKLTDKNINCLFAVKIRKETECMHALSSIYSASMMSLSFKLFQVPSPEKGLICSETWQCLPKHNNYLLSLKRIQSYLFIIWPNIQSMKLKGHLIWKLCRKYGRCLLTFIINIHIWISNAVFKSSE